MTAFWTALLTVLVGVLVLSFGQIVIRFFIEPYQEFSKARSRGLRLMSLYADLTHNPEPLANDPGERTEQLARLSGPIDELRSAAVSLRVFADTLPWFGCLSRVFSFPSRDCLTIASNHLLVLSRSLIAPPSSLATKDIQYHATIVDIDRELTILLGGNTAAREDLVKKKHTESEALRD